MFGQCRMDSLLGTSLPAIVAAVRGVEPSGMPDLFGDVGYWEGQLSPRGVIARAVVSQHLQLAWRSAVGLGAVG